LLMIQQEPCRTNKSLFAGEDGKPAPETRVYLATRQHGAGIGKKMGRQKAKSPTGQGWAFAG